MQQCYFAKEAPEIEIRNGVVFIRPLDSHCEVALSPATLSAFVARANRALDEFHERRTVVPLKARR